MPIPSLPRRARIGVFLVVALLAPLVPTLAGTSPRLALAAAHPPSPLHRERLRDPDVSHDEAVGPPTTAVLPPAPPAPPPAPIPPAGKGMWIWMPQRAEGGDVNAIVAKAKAAGLTHLYVRTGSSGKGNDGLMFVAALLPAAHAAGLRVIGWDFPNLANLGADILRAQEAMGFAPNGERLDGFAPDIETPSEGTRLTGDRVTTYLAYLRALGGPQYLLVACVMNPTSSMVGYYPYAQMAPYVDAFAPMVYWLNRQPDADVARAVDWLRQFGRAVTPIGQAYDGRLEGGRPGPTPEEITRFTTTAAAHGAGGVSFWSWQHASPEVWAALTTSPEVGVPG